MKNLFLVVAFSLLALSMPSFAQTNDSGVDSLSRGLNPFQGLKKSRFANQISITGPDRIFRYKSSSWLISSSSPNQLITGADGKLRANVDWTTLTGKPTTFAPSSHSHPITDLTGQTIAATVTGQTLALTVNNTSTSVTLPSGGGSTWIEKNVLDISGVRNDGVAFTPNNLNSYMATLSTTGGGTIVWPKSNNRYLLDCSTTSLIIPSNIHFRGLGLPKIAVSGSPNANTPPITSQSYTTQLGTGLPSAYDVNISIDGIEFDGLKSLNDTMCSGNYSGNIILFFGVKGLKISNCVVRNAKNDGITATICEDVSITKNIIYDTCKGGIYSSGNSRVVIANNIIDHVSGFITGTSNYFWGFSILVASTNMVTVVGNTINRGNTGISIDRATQNYTVSANTGKCYLGSATAFNIATDQTFNGGTTLRWWGTRNGTVTGNAIEGKIWIKGAEQLNFSNNIIRNRANWNTNVVWINEAKNLIFSNNQIICDANGVAIYLTNTAETNYGDFDNANNVQPNAGHTRNIDIFGNKIVVINTAVNALVMISCDASRISNNTLKNIIAHDNIYQDATNWGAIVSGFTSPAAPANGIVAYNNILNTVTNGFAKSDGSF